jgi:hypothetical protein
MQLGNVIACSAKQALSYSEKLLVGISREQFARFAVPGGITIVSNHPSFIFGHLSLYAPRILGELGADPSGLVVPDSFSTVYSRDAKCVDDPQGDIYPPMEDVVQFYFDGHQQVIEAIKKLPNEAWDKPNANTGAIARFPTMADMHAFYLGGHMMMHLGQLSAWRRAAGLPAA